MSVLALAGFDRLSLGSVFFQRAAMQYLVSMPMRRAMALASSCSGGAKRPGLRPVGRTP